MSCQHLKELTLEDMISKANYPVFRCEECLRVGDRWVHLRICQTCGKMLCCDSSKNQHARRHYEESGHAVISSAELGEQGCGVLPMNNRRTIERAPLFYSRGNHNVKSAYPDLNGYLAEFTPGRMARDIYHLAHVDSNHRQNPICPNSVD